MKLNILITICAASLALFCAGIAPHFTGAITSCLGVGIIPVVAMAGERRAK